MNKRQMTGLSQGNLGGIMGGLIVSMFFHVPVVTTLLIAGTVGFVSLLIEPPFFAWLDDRARRRSLHHFIIIPDAWCATQCVPKPTPSAGSDSSKSSPSSPAHVEPSKPEAKQKSE